MLKWVWKQIHNNNNNNDNNLHHFVGGYLFVLGGMSVEDRKPRNDVQRYDPTTNTWTLQAPMPYAACFPKVVALAGKLYVTGGYDDEVGGTGGECDHCDGGGAYVMSMTELVRL